ncbi:MAG: hypothetical protein COV52_09485 [Gammaproteobacteria bacterium CG11_big_fil_rev_8_21_14_0_20_46_22]|nr:MAG: hypothetical protein COW05_03595 [Gammaproteobacteria bacterium CG12_big_fil_rev_8_21_14_0_65_46_12]PIR10280.1 MAG: hypothetical protein COV52_09485 [Gammaproteobacteria bacterium CG11_big_fil_rev_8_21_14_0_20_46_22]
MMRAILLNTLELAVNRYIKLDSFYRQKLKRLSGRYLEVDLQDAPVTFYVGFYDDRVTFQPALQGKADVRIQATPINLLRVLTEDNAQALLSKQRINIEGDFLLAQAVGEFFKSIRIDWAHYLKPFLGDAMNGQAALLKTKACESLSNTQQKLDEDLREYLQHELAVLPNRDEFEHFKTAVSHLRDRVERLEVKQRLDHSGENA